MILSQISAAFGFLAALAWALAAWFSTNSAPTGWGGGATPKQKQNIRVTLVANTIGAGCAAVAAAFQAAANAGLG